MIFLVTMICSVSFWQNKNYYYHIYTYIGLRPRLGTANIIILPILSLPRRNLGRIRVHVFGGQMKGPKFVFVWNNLSLWQCSSICSDTYPNRLLGHGSPDWCVCGVIALSCTQLCRAVYSYTEERATAQLCTHTMLQQLLRYILR